MTLSNIESSVGIDYVSWCELVMKKLAEAGSASSSARHNGIEENALGRLILGALWEEARRSHPDLLFDAVLDLYKAGLIEDGNATLLKLSWEGRKAAENVSPIWEGICAVNLDPTLTDVLAAVNRRSPVVDEMFALASYVDLDSLLGEINSGMEMEDLQEAARLLRSRAFLFWENGDYPQSVRSTYSGLVWEMRRDLVSDSRFVDALVDEWETTSVEFKRELILETADQKAKFVKELISLANTQASGRRWLIVGFDDKTREYHGPPGDKVTQNRIEQILSQYVEPSLNVRYRVIAYKGFGKAGILEVLREPKKLPYRVSQSLGEKKSGGERIITAGQVFVRHGSQIEEPSDNDLQAIIDEARRAMLG